MRLNKLKPATGSSQAKKRVGRGMGSGFGKTCGRGHKGQKSRAGGFHKVGFEGGQMSFARRLPKRGFTSRTAGQQLEVRLFELEKLSEARVDLSTLKKAGIVPANAKGAKVILSGELSKKIHLCGIAASKGVRAAIEKCGGSVEGGAEKQADEAPVDKGQGKQAVAKQTADVAKQAEKE